MDLGELLGRLLGLEQIRLEDGEVSLDWASPVEPWLAALVAAAVFAGAMAIYSRERQEVGRGTRIFLSALRTLSILLVLVMLLGPILTVDIAQEKRSVVIVLIDESMSMGKRDPRPQVAARLDALASVCDLSPEETARSDRLALVRAALGNRNAAILEALQVRFRVAVFAFSRIPRTIRPEEIAGLEPAGTETAVGDAIQQAVGQFRGEQVAAVVLFSDGRTNTGRDPVDVARQLGKRKVNILAVAPGFPQPPMDVALGDLQARDTVPVNDHLSIRYSLTSQGFGEREVPLDVFLHRVREEGATPPTDPDGIERLLRDAETRLLETLRPALREGTRTPDELPPVQWTPRERGLFWIVLRARPHEDELTRKNNYAIARVRVTDDLVKVLYVDHLPRWEYRYLKNAMIRNNNFLVHCLLTSADTGFPQDHSLAEGRPREQVEEYRRFFQSITEFPSDRKTLLQYEVVVLGDVHPAKLGGEPILRNLSDFVKEFGGGLVFIAGTRFNPEAFRDTPLEELLPVEPMLQRTEPNVFDRELQYSLSEFGRRHAATKFVPNVDENARIWEEPTGLPYLFWFKRVKGLKPGAVFPLVYVQPVRDGGGRYPLFLWQPAGRGRVFMSLTDETWRWRFNRGDAPYFFPFWQQTLRWLREPRLHSSRRYNVRVERERYAIGEKVEIRATAYDADYQPLADPRLGLEVVPPTGGALKFEMHGDGKGGYSLTFTPQDVGRHEVRVGDPAEPAEMGVQSFEVFIPNREDENPIIDKDRLGHIARESGGTFLTLDEAGRIPENVRTSIHHLTETLQDDIWDSPLFYLIFALLLTVEWIARKMLRML